MKGKTVTNSKEHKYQFRFVQAILFTSLVEKEMKR